LVNRRRHIQVDPKRPLHWAEPHIAKLHRQEDLAADGLWTCECAICDRVKDAVFAVSSFAQLGRIWGGAR
jgi:hypothetical protein